MQNLMDCLDEAKWMSVEVADRGEGFKEFHVMRQHKLLSPGVMKYLIEEDDGDAFGVTVEWVKKDMDPLKGIGTCELKLDDDHKKVIGIDLDGDLVKLK